jgi:DNA polymerase IV
MSPDSLYQFHARPLRWFYVDFNSYFASVEQQLNPHLRGRPTIVVPMPTDSTCAIAASVEAKRFGIRTGTKVYEAKRLCSDLAIVTADHRHYVDFHHRLIAVIEDHIPITRVGSIDEVACRLLDNENSPEQARALATRIKAAIADRVGACLTCSIGVAPSPLLAKLASDAQKPDGFVIFEGHTLPDSLFGMKLNDICGVGRNMSRRLAGQGIWSIADFCALGPRRAGAVWGSRGGDRLWFELHGMEMPAIETQTRSLGHSHVLAPENRAPLKALTVLRRLTLKAAARLRRKGYQTKLVAISVRLEDGGKWKGALPALPTQDSFALLHPVDELWRLVMADVSPLPLRVRFKQVAVTFLDLEPVTVAQPSLFDMPAARHSRPPALSNAIDRLNEKYQRPIVTLASNMAPGIKDMGTKVAFTRIPELAEFHE